MIGGAPVVLGLAALGTSIAASSVHVTSHGGIGPLAVDRSTRAAVVAFAGRPGAEQHGYAPNQGAPQFDALGYGCTARRNRGWPVGKHGTYCRTVFWINVRRGRLGDFYTQDSRYVDAHGIRVGTSSAVAEQRLHERLFAGCEENLQESRLTIAFVGGTRHADGHVTGARVYALAISGDDSVGVFDCL